MNGGADLGGSHGFGPVVEEADEPLFHADWETRVMAMVIACGPLGQWNLDQSRFARESLFPPDYQTFSYYRIWLAALEKLLLEHGMVTAEEMASGTVDVPAVDTKPALEAERVAEVLKRGGPVDREPDREAAFVVGDAVRTVNEHPSSHTRLPRYARGRTGTVAKVLGFHVFPDTNALGLGEQPTWLYQVRFEARELFGESRPAGDAVTLDLWESYLRGT